MSDISTDKLAFAQTARVQAQCLHTVEQVQAAYRRLAQQITTDFAGKNPLILGVMNGGLYATAGITQYLDFAFELGYVHASRYRGELTGQDLRWIQPPPDCAEREVLIIDDILDEGYTLSGIAARLREQNPKTLKIAVLCEKLHARKAPDAYADYIGLPVPDRYVFGCGLDVKGYFRQLPDIWAI